MATKKSLRTDCELSCIFSQARNSISKICTNTHTGWVSAVVSRLKSSGVKVVLEKDQRQFLANYSSV